MVRCTGGKLVANSPGIPHIQPAHVVTQLEIAQYMIRSQHFFTLIKQELLKFRGSLTCQLLISTTSLTEPDPISPQGAYRLDIIHAPVEK